MTRSPLLILRTPHVVVEAVQDPVSGELCGDEGWLDVELAGNARVTVTVGVLVGVLVAVAVLVTVAVAVAVGVSVRVGVAVAVCVAVAVLVLVAVLVAAARMVGVSVGPVWPKFWRQMP